MFLLSRKTWWLEKKLVGDGDDVYVVFILS